MYAKLLVLALVGASFALANPVEFVEEHEVSRTDGKVTEALKQLINELKGRVVELEKKANEVIEEQRKIWAARIEEAKKISQEEYEKLKKRAEDVLQKLEKTYKKSIEVLKQKLQELLEKVGVLPGNEAAFKKGGGVSEGIEAAVGHLKELLQNLETQAKAAIEEQKKIWEARLEEAKKVSQEEYEKMKLKAKEALKKTEEAFKSVVEKLRKKIEELLEKIGKKPEN